MSMKKGINAWCFPKDMSIQDIFALASSEGYEGIEVNMTGDEKGKAYLTIENWEQDCAELVALSKKYSLPIYSISTGYFWGYPLTDNDPAKVEKAKTAVCRMLDAAAAVGADTILTVPGLVTPTVSYRTAYQRAKEAFDTLREYAEGVKVTIGIENVWNKFLLSPLEMRNFIDSIGSDYVKAYFDAGNVLQFSYPEHWLEILSGQVAKVHIKDFDTSIGNIQGFTNLLEGDMNWQALMNALRQAGYDSYITPELSPYKTNPSGLIRDTKHALDYILGL